MQENSTLKESLFASKALKINSSSGDAILVLGDAIRYTKCDDGKAGAWSRLWLAVDYYNRAKAVDPSVGEKAVKRIRGCKAGYPEVSEVFMTGIKNGDSYTHCNGESTTVRTK